MMGPVGRLIVVRSTMLLASALGNLGMKALTSHIPRLRGFKWASAVDVIVASIFTILCGVLTPDTPLVWTLIVVFVYDLARAMHFTTQATLAYTDVPQTDERRQHALERGGPDDDWSRDCPCRFSPCFGCQAQRNGAESLLVGGRADPGFADRISWIGQRRWPEPGRQDRCGADRDAD